MSKVSDALSFMGARVEAMSFSRFQPASGPAEPLPTWTARPVTVSLSFCLCTICNVSFKTAYGARMHARAVHGGGR